MLRFIAFKYDKDIVIMFLKSLSYLYGWNTISGACFKIGEGWGNRGGYKWNKIGHMLLIIEAG